MQALLIVKLIYFVLWNFDLICQPHGRRVIRTLKAIATVLQTAVDLHLYRSPRRCVRDSNPRGFYTQTVFKTAPSTCRTRNINLSFQIVRPPSSHFLIINQNQSDYLAQSRVIETQSCRITRLSRSVPHLVNLLCKIGGGVPVLPKETTIRKMTFEITHNSQIYKHPVRELNPCYCIESAVS